MPQNTPYLHIAFFNLGDNLQDMANVQKEMERFVIIDRELYGLYSIFGSGVIDGWQVVTAEAQDASEISVDVTSGIGIINLMAAETTIDDTVRGLPPNQTVYIFARITGITATTRSVEFFFSRTATAPRAIKLATVVTGNTGIVAIDNTVRHEIGFKSLIEEEIRKHRHRGTPSKIDLDLETKGQLPGNKIADVPAELVTSGQFPVERIPLMNHASLTDIGIFSHAELDAMVRKLDGLPQHMMEVALANELKQHIFLKYKYPDVDEHFLNEIIFIPGISPNEQIDWEATTAVVNTDTNCISGKPAPGGRALHTLWANKAAFDLASYKDGVEITSEGVHIQRAALDTIVVEGFEAAQNGSLLSSFKATLQTVDDQTGVYADQSVQTEAGFSGRFLIDQKVRAVFTKEFATPQNWTAYDKLVLSVKCTEVAHGAVYMYLVGSTGNSSVVRILDKDYRTTNTDPNMDGFEERNVMINSFAREAVSKIVIYAEDVHQEYTFYVDNIRLMKTQMYRPQGVIRLRSHTDNQVVYNSLVYDTVKPTGTEVRARVRVADTEVDLDSALYTSYLGSSDVFTLYGKWVEVEVTLYSDATQNLSPTLALVEVGLVASAEESEVVVDEASEWVKGTTINVDVTGTDSALVTVAAPVTVKNISFLTNMEINEIDEDNRPVFGLGSGSGLPVSEMQAWLKIHGGTGNPGLSIASSDAAGVMSAVRTMSRQWIVCDTDNDRILIFDSAGRLVRGYCGANYNIQGHDNNENFSVLTATYYEARGLLWLGFSKEITVPADEFSKIEVYYGGNRFDLSVEGQVLASGNEPITGRAIRVPLTDEHRSYLSGRDDVTVKYGDKFMDGYAEKVSFLTPLTVYYAPVTYHPFIFRPVYAAPSAKGNLWICNATKLPFADKNARVDPWTPETRNLQEFNPDVDLDRFSNSVYFTTQFGGHIREDSNGDLYVCGVDQQRNGKVYRNPMTSLVEVYTSPVGNQPTMADVALDGNLWISESSYYRRGGRLVKMDTRGNILRTIVGQYTKVNSVQALTDGTLLVGC